LLEVVDDRADALPFAAPIIIVAVVTAMAAVTVVAAVATSVAPLED
jgi:hypothetical protein